LALAPRSEAFAALLFTAFAVAVAFAPGMMPDFFIYRLGSGLAARGENPYDPATVRARVAAQFPGDGTLAANCGYFLPPQATLLFLPFALLPLAAAKVAWALLQGLAAFAIATLPRLLRRPADPAPAGLIPRLVPFLLLLNFLALAAAMKGQVPLLSAGCVSAGLWCFATERRWGFWLGVLLWSVPFVKPHVALALVPLAWYLGGWRRAAALVGVVATFNLLGATLVGGSPLFLRDYLDFLSAGHRAVQFNRAELNYEITSWNRLLFVGTGVLVEQDAAITLASYCAWFALVLGRCAIGGARPSAAWALAACAAAMVLCPQVLGYEALALVLAVPWVRDLFAHNRRTWGWLAVAVLALQAVPFQVVERVGFDFHRPLGVALFALLVLVGPLYPTKRD
jgi:hypothetical protein